MLGRCKSTNLCEYCARLAAVENAEMLALDAIDGRGPAVWCVLTTRSVEHDGEAYYKPRRELLRRLRADLGRQVEYASVQEFTSGYGPRSGGQRRPHWNLMLKGVAVEDIPRIETAVRETWCQLEDAEPEAQYVGAVRDVGLMRYLALHFQKESQQPPDGWSGQRFNCSRGYFGQLTRAQARSRARESLRWKRELWLARKRGADDPGAAADAALREQRDHVWTLCTDRGTRLSSVGQDARLRTLPRDRATNVSGVVTSTRRSYRVAWRREADRARLRRSGTLRLFRTSTSGVSGRTVVRR